MGSKVELHPSLVKAFQFAQPTLRICWFVKKLNHSTMLKKMEERLLIITESNIFVCKESGEVRFCAFVEDLEDVQHFSGNPGEILLRFKKENRDPALLLLLNNDARNRPEQPDPAFAAQTLAELFSAWKKLPLQVRDSEHSLRGAVAQGLLKKPDGYMKAEQKWKLWNEKGRKPGPLPSQARMQTRQPSNPMPPRQPSAARQASLSSPRQSPRNSLGSPPSSPMARGQSGNPSFASAPRHQPSSTMHSERSDKRITVTVRWPGGVTDI